MIYTGRQQQIEDGWEERMHDPSTEKWVKYGVVTDAANTDAETEEEGLTAV